MRDIHVGTGGADVLSGGGWQKISIPFTDFYDDNSYYAGGNGILDAVGTGDGGNGMMVNVVVAIINESGADISFRTDRWAFTRRTSTISGRIWDDLDGDGCRRQGVVQTHRHLPTARRRYSRSG